MFNSFHVHNKINIATNIGYFEFFIWTHLDIDIV